MKVTFHSILICVVLLSSGCANNVLVERLKDHDVTAKNTAKLKFVSSPGAFGPDTLVMISEPETIESVWSKIKCATATKRWYASGDHRIEFFTSAESEKPAAVVLLNASDAAHLEGDLWYHLDSERPGYYGLWKCPGLNELVMRYLKQEYTHRKSSS